MGVDGGSARDYDKVAGYFASRRALIVPALESLGARRGRELDSTPGGAGDSLARIVRFCRGGKMIRGALVFLAADAASAAKGAVWGAPRAEGARGAAASALLPSCAAAMELFQAGLLAHDDIMDRDELRRGAPSLHAAYTAEARAGGATDPLHTGEALGICLGDLCYFEAFAELARALGESPQSARILGLCASILSEVALAQMADVRWGASGAEVGEAEILAMYRCKTARYSFSLPLAVGAFAAGAPDLVPPLIELGEELGILFQLRDDELGLFGDSGATGKGLASDLREGKKTLFRARLLAAAPREEESRLRELFDGRAVARPEDLAYIGVRAAELGVAASIRELSAKAEGRAIAIISSLPGLSPVTAGIFEGLVDYVTRREK